MHFLIAYDIAQPRRLQRVARLLERHAVRCQKSVFLYEGDAASIKSLLADVSRCMKLSEDVAQAWRLASDQSPLGLIRGTPLLIFPAGVILASDEQRMIDPTFLRESATRFGNPS